MLPAPPLDRLDDILQRDAHLKSADFLDTATYATTKINRKDLGLAWNMALETGGVIVGAEVKITLDIELVKSA